jgi:hypothetical protein
MREVSREGAVFPHAHRKSLGYGAEVFGVGDSVVVRAWFAERDAGA